MSKRLAIVIGVVAAGVMVLGAQTATPLASQTVKIDSKVTFAIDCAPHGRRCGRVRIHGSVTSSKHACEVQRTVKFFAPRRPGPDRLLGKDKTNSEGRWQFHLEPHPGRRYAKVVGREVHTGGTTFLCHGDRSPTQDFH